MKFWKKKSKYIDIASGRKRYHLGTDPRSVEPSFTEAESRFAILGDIHANLEALEAVLADIKEQGAAQIVCVGDVVGYAANPSECLEIIRDLDCPVVQGNHDSYAATGDSLKEFNLNALNAILWTREHLSDDEKQWLLGLPLELTLNSELGTLNAELVHSSLNEPEQWHYILKPEKAEPALQTQDPDIVFFGHTHVPALYSFNPETKEFKSKFPLSEGTHELAAGWKHLINSGSVGQPRDRDTRASYAIYDPKAGIIEIRRVEYDIKAAQQKIEAAGLPLRNAERLAKGR